MDPTATFAKLIEAHENDDMFDLREAYSDLIGWLNKGGSYPELARLDKMHVQSIVEWILREVSIAIIVYETPDSEK